MKEASVSILVLLIFALSIGACDHSNEHRAVTSHEPQVTMTSNESQTVTTSGPVTARFVWRPTKGLSFGSDVVNREAFGMVDGDDTGHLPFRGRCGRWMILIGVYPIHLAIPIFDDIQVCFEDPVTGILT